MPWEHIILKGMTMYDIEWGFSDYLAPAEPIKKAKDHVA